MQISIRSACVIIFAFLAIMAPQKIPILNRFVSGGPSLSSSMMTTTGQDQEVPELDFCDAACIPPHSNSSAADCTSKPSTIPGSKSRYAAACERVAGTAVLAGSCQRMCLCEQGCLRTFQEQYEHCMEKKSISCTGKAQDAWRDCVYECT